MAKGLPVLVLLDHYPRGLDNEAGDRFAHVLSHVASACIANHGPAVPTVSLGTLVSQVEEHLRKGDAVSPPEEVRHNLVAAAGTLLAMVRKYDDLFPLPAAEADCDMPPYEPDGPYFGPRHDLPLKREGGARG